MSKKTMTPKNLLFMGIFISMLCLSTNMLAGADCIALSQASEQVQQIDIAQKTDIEQVKSDLIRLAYKLFAEVQMQGSSTSSGQANLVVDQFMAAYHLNKKESLAVLVFAAQIALQNSDVITNKLLQEEYDRILHMPKWYIKGAGIFGKTVCSITKFCFIPLKKGFDGACYAVGAVVGVSTVGAVVAAVPVAIAVFCYKKFIL